MGDETAQFATFRVHGLYCGIDVLRVQEVLREQPMTPVPLAPPVIEGLLNLRGQIVTALDVRRRLGLPQRPADQPPMNVILRADDGVVSLLVDDIGEVLTCSRSALEAAPPHLSPAILECTERVCRLEGDLLLVLSTEKIANS